MTVYIIFTVAGSDTGPFNLYSNVDGYVSPFASGISKSTLLSGYTSTVVPLGTTTIRAISAGTCTNYIDMSISSTTTSTTTLFPTTTTTTTAVCSTILVDVTVGDLAAATGNSTHPDNTLFVRYTDCSNSLIIDTFTVADVSSSTSECWNHGTLDVYIYINDIETAASTSFAYVSSPCTP